MPDVAFITLGCRVNQCDTAEIAAAFRRRGFSIVSPAAPADVYIINSCAVTGRSEAKSRQAARQCARARPAALVVLYGCYPAVAAEAARAVAGVDLVAGPADRSRLVDLVAGALAARPDGPADAPATADAPTAPFGPAGALAEGGGALAEGGGALAEGGGALAEGGGAWEGRTRANVKVQEGCAEFCSYCIVPQARGPLRSRPPDEVVAEVRALAGRGCREVVLCGTHLGAYGSRALVDLLRQVAAVADLARVRLSSIEPMDASEELVRAVATWPRVCRHLHMPLQSGSDRILTLMGRRYTVDDFMRLVGLARRLEPDIGLTTDVMVGFPGEAEDDFSATLDAVERAAFSRMHVFPYSPRPGTRAAHLPGRVPAAVKRERCQRLSARDDSLRLAFHRRLLGRAVEVLVEGRATGAAVAGLTSNYVRAVVLTGGGAGGDGGDGACDLQGRLIDVVVEEATAEGVVGRQGCRPR